MGSAARTSVAVLLLCLALASCEDRRSPVDQAANWWPPSQRANARCIIWEESRNDPTATGNAGEAGLTQLHPVHAREFERLTGRSFWPNAWNPVLNGQASFALWKRTGWRSWSTARRCGL